MLKKIEDGPYKGQYEGRHGIIYSEEIAKLKFPELFKAPPRKKAVKKSSKKRVK